MTLDRPERGHSRINVFGSADAPRKNGSDRMKKKTMAIFAVAAFVILSVVLIQAVDTDARAGDSEADPKYIIGDTDAGKELRGGLEARISFNKTAFSENSEVKFEVKVDNDYTTLQQDLTKVGSTGISVGISALDAQSGVYAVKFMPNEDPLEGGIIFIKMTVTEKLTASSTSSTDTLEQYFYYAAHISENTEVAFNIQGNAAEYYQYGPAIDGFPTPNTLKINFDQSVKLALSMQEKSGGNWGSTTKDGYTFYGTDLPKGLSVTIDGYIGGKLDPTVGAGSTGDMTIHAVKNGLDTKLEIPYKIGEQPTTEPDFKFTVDDIETEHVVKKVNGSFTVKVENIRDKGTIKNYTVDAKPSNVTPFGSQSADKAFTVEGYESAGTYIVTISALMEYNGDAVTVQKTFTAYVVGGIYDGSLKPVVNPA